MDFSTEVKEDEPEWELCNPISMCIWINNFFAEKNPLMNESQ